MPTGDWFDIVACPHYLAEVVIYSGMYITGGCRNVTAAFMLLWVLVNLAITARKTRQWYVAKFEGYPSTRKDMIPGIM
eukprot:17151-Eustigmatos_ZCMA.PRE.1